MKMGRLGLMTARLAASLLGSPGLLVDFSRVGPRYSRPKGYRTISRLNRSRHHPPARSYAHAREIARDLGHSTRPVC